MEKIIREIGKEYDLPEREILRGVEIAILRVLGRRGKSVDVWMNDSGIDIWKFSDNKIARIDNENLNPKTLRRIKREVSKELLLRSVVRKWKSLRDLVKMVVIGKIIRIDQNGDLHVSITQDIESAFAVAVCKTASQTPKERGRYKEGMTLPFYVLSVLAIQGQGTPRVDIFLSRNSKGLTETLLKQAVQARGGNARIKCDQRIAGAFSVVTVSERIPKEVITKVSNLLDEGIKVYVKKNN